MEKALKFLNSVIKFLVSVFSSKITAAVWTIIFVLRIFYFHFFQHSFWWMLTFPIYYFVFLFLVIFMCIKNKWVYALVLAVIFVITPRVAREANSYVWQNYAYPRMEELSAELLEIHGHKTAVDVPLEGFDRWLAYDDKATVSYGEVWFLQDPGHATVAEGYHMYSTDDKSNSSYKRVYNNIYSVLGRRFILP